MKLFLSLLILSPGLVSLQVSGQSKDPGSSPPPDSVPAKHTPADSSHHTDTVHYHFTYASAGTINTTNSSRSYVLNNAFKASMVKKSAAVNFSNSWIYGRQLGILTNNDFTSTLDLGLYKTLRHFYYWGLASYNTSISLMINSQLQTGLGLGYNLIDKKTAVLIISDGVLYEKGDLYDSLYGGPNGNEFRHDQYQETRNSFRLLAHWVINGMYTFDGTGFIQNAFSDWNDYYLKLNAGISLKLYKWLNFTVSGTYNKFTRTRSRNTLVNFGLTIIR